MMHSLFSLQLAGEDFFLQIDDRDHCFTEADSEQTILELNHRKYRLRAKPYLCSPPETHKILEPQLLPRNISAKEGFK